MNEETLPEPYKFSKGYIILPYELPGIAPTIEIDGETLFAKPAFHMSILSVKKYASSMPYASVPPTAAEEAVLVEAAKLLLAKPIKVTGLRDEFRLAKEEEKKTVVVMCGADGIEEFFAGINKISKSLIPTQPTHITLYTRENGPGIGLTNAEELKNLTRPLKEDEKKMVMNAINISSR